jgi:tetratricopeptide (TPR) repeat protein/tRNA A-37 threonylcarbamoyl transferase component Bud32
LDVDSLASFQRAQLVLDLLARAKPDTARQHSEHNPNSCRPDALEHHTDDAIQFRSGLGDDCAAEDCAPENAGAGDIPKYFGRFELLSELGRGGFGVVFLVHDPVLNRQVALKIPRPEALLTTDLRRRFLREAEAAARLTHPNLAAVYETGEVGAICYIATAYCKGPTLAAWLAQQPRPTAVSQAAAIIADLADAVHYAHSLGILHRDIKPSNVILVHERVDSNQGDTSQADISEALYFTPKLVDFGLARVEGPTADETRSGAVFGTPAYMSPEQAEGRQSEIDVTSDVYGLGAVLYHVLMGEAPFRGLSDAATLSRVLHDEPISPRRIRSGVPRDLEAICLKCLEKQPRRRYQSAAELAADLRHFLAGEITMARPMNAIERTWRTIKRRPVVWGLTTLVALLLVTLAIGSTVSAVAIAAAHDNARRTAEAERAARTRADKALVAERQQRERAERAETEAKASAGRAQDEADKAEQHAEFLVGLFQSSDPTGLGGMALRLGGERVEDVSARELLDRGAKKIDGQLADQPLIRATLLDSLGNVYRSICEFDVAEGMLREALNLRQELLPDDHPELAASLHHMGWLLRDQGRPAEAEPLLRRALSILEQNYGRDDLRVAEVEFNLAWALRDKSSFGTAQIWPLFEHVLEVRRQHLGESHRDVAVTLSALMALALDLSDEETAKRLGMEALAVYLQQEGGEVLGRAIVTYHQAVLERRDRRFAEAEELYRETLALVTSFLGDAHPVRALLLGDLAGMQRQAGRLGEAEDTLRESIDLGKKFFPRGHPRLVAPLGELAQACLGRGEYSEAESLTREALSICRTSAANTPIENIVIRDLLDEICRNTGRLDEALALQAEALEIAEHMHPGDREHQLRNRRFCRAELLQAVGEQEQADTIWEQLIAIDGSIKSRLRLATSLIEQGRLQEAETLLSNVTPIIEPPLAEVRKLDEAEAMIVYARLLLRKNESAQAEPFFRLAKAIRERLCSRGHWEIAEAQALLGASLAAQGKFDEARPVLAAAHADLLKSRGPDHKLTREVAGYLSDFE